MNKEVQKVSEKLGSKTILLPQNKISDCYAVYSKSEFKNADKKLLVDGKYYKHRLYFYKKLNNKSKKILTFIFLKPGIATHKKFDFQINKCIEIAGNKYGAIEIFSIFTLRTIDKIDAISENAMLDVIRMDLSKNDIVFAFGGKIKKTLKYNNISNQDLLKINKVRHYKVNELLNFLMNMPNRKGKIYVIGMTSDGFPKSLYSYKGQPLIEFVL